MSLKQACALSLIGLLTATVAGVAGDVLQVTPLQALGPYYPVIKPADQDGDLTVIKGKKRSAEGQILYIVGRVLTKEGKPVSGARVEIWQTNAKGRYNHPSDTNEAPLDPYFQGYGTAITNADGGFRFKTVKPAAYPAGSMTRPPHVHFQVTGTYDRLVTQMYLPGEPLNDKDPLFNEAGVGRDALIARIVPSMKGMERDAIVALWNIVLHKG